MADDMADVMARFGVKQGRGRQGAAPRPDHLGDLTGFGPNPGALNARSHVPANLAPGAALVVVLHGCTQSAAGYDRGAGWSGLADEAGFALLFPEQTTANNPQRCFNWFTPADTRRDSGEAASIAAMVGAMIARHDLDPARVFVTGLSAGGAMASVMLATYPELFAGGAIIAGLPYAGVAGVPRALEAMRTPTAESADALAERVRAASTHGGPWPRVSVWHGLADQTVAAGNADAVARQWTGVSGLAPAPTRTERVGAHEHRVWIDTDGRVGVEEWRIAGMGHGTPIGEGVGVAGPFMLDVGLSSTRRIAVSWGVASGVDQSAPKRASRAPASPPRTRRLTPEPLDARAAGGTRKTGVAKVIEDALRSAGLMR